MYGAKMLRQISQNNQMVTIEYQDKTLKDLYATVTGEAFVIGVCKISGNPSNIGKTVVKKFYFTLWHTSIGQNFSVTDQQSVLIYKNFSETIEDNIEIISGPTIAFSVAGINFPPTPNNIFEWKVLFTYSGI